MIWIVFLAIILISYLYLKHQRFKRYWIVRGVPSVKPFPIIGNYYKTLIGKPMPEVVLELYRAKPQAKVLGLYFFGRTPLMIRDPALITKICVKDFDYFVDHFSPSESNANEPFLSKNLSVLKGEHWRGMRSTLSPAFTGSKMRNMFQMMTEIVENFVKHYRNKCHEENLLPLNVELNEMYTKLANDVIATTAFGLQCNSFDEPHNIFYQMGQMTQQFQIWRMFLLILSPKLWKLTGLSVMPAKVHNYFSKIVKNAIEIRQNHNIVRPDMIHLMLEAQKGSLKYGQSEKETTGFMIEEEMYTELKQKKISITDDDIIVQAFTFFIAGFGTVSAALSFASYELALNPEIQNLLQEEIDKTLISCNGKLTYDALNKITYLDMIVLETLRKWPVPVTDRVCTKPYKLSVDDFTVKLKPGDLIHLPIFGLHRDPKYFPEPDKFDPERFNEANRKNILPSTYFPFGIGPRTCIGSRFALMEIKLALFYTFANFKLVVTDNTDIPLKLKPGAALAVDKFCLGLGLRTKKEF